ncbi:MAG: prenyltransferase/squalene oxidase repeat-containing protein [Gemmataceae bacterium]
MSKEEPKQPVEELRESLSEFLRRLESNEIGELDAVGESERKLLGDLLQLYNAHRDRLSQAPPPVKRPGHARPIDAVEVEILLDRYGIQDADLEDETLTPACVVPRRTLQTSVRQNQKLSRGKLSDLCAAMNAVLQARGTDAAVTQAEILPVSISLTRLRQCIATSSSPDEAALVQAANDRIPGQLAVVERRGKIRVPNPELRVDLLKEGETISLMHFQLRALIAALGVPEKSLLSHQSAPQPEAAAQWVHSVGLGEVVERINRAHQLRDGGFRIDPHARPGSDNPTQPYTTAQCVVGLLRAGHAENGPKMLQGALKFLVGSRRDYQVGQGVVRGWRYFVHDGTELDYPIADIACWVIVAEAAALRRTLWQGEQKTQALGRLTENIEGLLKQQASSGGFVPIPQVEDRYVRTYTTCMAIWALVEAVWAEKDGDSAREEWVTALNRSLGWLLDNHRREVGFIPDPNVPRSEFFPGLHAQCVFTLSLVGRLKKTGILPDCVDSVADSDRYLAAARLLADWFSSVRRRVEEHNVTIDRHSHFHPTRYRLENTRNLWAPWALAAFHHMGALGVEDAESLRNQVAACFRDFWQRGGEEWFGCNGTYELAESLYCFAHLLGEEM